MQSHIFHLLYRAANYLHRGRLRLVKISLQSATIIYMGLKCIRYEHQKVPLSFHVHSSHRLLNIMLRCDATCFGLQS